MWNDVLQFNEFKTVAQRGSENTSDRLGDRAESSGANLVRLWSTCPHTDTVTEYDRRNLSLYAILLHSEFEGGSVRHMAEVFFHIPFDRYPQRAVNVVRTHLARAHWMKNNVYPLLDW